MSIMYKTTSEKQRFIKNFLLVIGSVLFVLLFLEGMMRFFVKPSEESYGNLFGIELPPLKIVQKEMDRNQWFKKLVVKGKKITVGDLWGYYKEDPTIGYIPKENMISPNNWWQTNNIGARSKKDTYKHKAPNITRIIVFGESFTNCSRVSQEDTWPNFLEQKGNNIEVINFGVDGYSMGQSLLRFEAINKQIQFDMVLLVFVPTFDLDRDIGVFRWGMVFPRFIIEGEKIKLIKSPYETRTTFYEKNLAGLSEELNSHLKVYDRFFSPPLYKTQPIIGRLVLYKWLVRKYYNFKTNQLRKHLMQTDSEAIQVTKKIIETMNKEVRENGKEIFPIILPVHQDINQYEKNHGYRVLWNEMSNFICQNNSNCIDLMKDFSVIPQLQLDTGYDGSHYGPKANQFIADLIWKRIKGLTHLALKGEIVFAQFK